MAARLFVRPNWNDFRPGLQLVEIIRPSLHHLAAFRHVFSVVVGGAYIVTFGVCQLAFYGVPVPALFVEQGGRHASETVTGHVAYRVAKPTKPRVDGVLAHVAVIATRTGKLIASLACQCVKLPQD